MDQQLLMLLSGLGFIILHLIHQTKGKVVEKTTSTCNGPCGQLSLSCPLGQRVAIRDAIYSVQKKTALCRTFKGCSRPNQDICCDQTPQDCVFAYSSAHIKTLHRNCSGNNACVIQTQRSEMETVKCPTQNVQLLSSQTTLNYICVSDSLVAEICSAKDTVIQGRTVFAMMDSRSSHRPVKGSVCTCIAESITWPTTNKITAFLVDMRLNVLDSSECANASLSIRSGNIDKALNCQTVSEVKMNFPFVAVLNESNVATLRLELGKNLPEFIWLGFEANENEDIRLTCKLQGLSPVASPADDVTLQDLENIFNYDSQDSDKEKTNVPAIIGGSVAGVVLVAVAVVIIVLVIRKRKGLVCGAKARSQPESDFTYYSTTDEALRSFQSTPVTEDSRKESKSVQALYVSTEEVLANKRKSHPEHVRIISAHGFSDEQEAGYATMFERDDQSQRARSRNSVDNINVNSRSSTNNNYDRLRRQTTGPCDNIFESYDQLRPETIVSDSYSSASGSKVQRSKKKHVLENSNRDPSKGTVNEAFDDTADRNNGVKLNVKTQGKELEDYFGLEKQSSASLSNALYCGMDEPPPPLPRKTAVGGLSTSLPSVKRSSTTDNAGASTPYTSRLADGDHVIYNDAKSEPAVVKQGKPDVYRNNVSTSEKYGAEADITNGDASKGDTSATEQKKPVAAPRRKSRGNMGSGHHDTGKPM